MERNQLRCMQEKSSSLLDLHHKSKYVDGGHRCRFVEEHSIMPRNIHIESFNQFILLCLGLGAFISFLNIYWKVDLDPWLRVLGLPENNITTREVYHNFVEITKQKLSQFCHVPACVGLEKLI